MRGTAFMKDWEKRALAEREAIVVTARCAFCRWNQTGTVQATREAHAEHRATKHPNIQPAARRKRHRLYGQLQSGKTLDENIAEARKHGASAWAGPE